MIKLSDIRKSIKKDDGLYIKILLWAFDRQETGFTRQELYDKFAPTPELNQWVRDIFFWGTNDDRPLIKHFVTRDNNDYFTLTDKGISAAVDYLELRQARRGGYVAAAIGVSALIVSVYTGWLTQQSLQITRDSLEISAPTVLNIIPNHNALDSEIDSVEHAMGMIPASNSIAELLVVNNSTPTIIDADIRMTLWALDNAPESGVFRVCPMGYVDHYHNPEFVVSDLRVDNVLNTKFTLETGESYPMTFNYSDLGFSDFWGGKLSEKAARFVKIDIVYKKKSGQVIERYTKVFRIFNSERLVDVELAPEFGSMIALRKIESRDNPYDLPSVFYPFQNKEFIEYLKSLPRPDNMSFGECQKFKIDKEVPLLTY